MRLIDADALEDKVADLYSEGEEATEGDKVVNDVIDLIDNAPTVDTTCPNCDSGYAQGYSDGYLKGKEERPTGEWIFDKDGYFYCSNCKKYPVYQVEYSDYCPNCGAKMTKEAENEI